MTREGTHHRAIKVEDVPQQWRNLIIGAIHEALDDNMLALHYADIERMVDEGLAAVAPLIAAAERERCAREVDCGCINRDAVLSAETKADRWRACPRDPCGAVEAAAIRAMGDKP